MSRSQSAQWVVMGVISTTLLILGCGADGRMSEQAGSRDAAKFMSTAQAAVDDAPARSEAAGRTNDKVVAATPRRVIYTADVSMQTRDFTHAERSLPVLVEELGGYLTDVSLNRQQGEQRSGRWQARVPAEHFHEFLEGLDKLGVPERRQVSGQDVTEEYIDLETRLQNKKRLEERLLELMKAKSGSVTDVIEFERQVAQVREEIERMEGRFRYLMNRSDLSSVSVQLREVQEYVPVQEPTFATRLDETWAGMIGTFRGWGEGAVLGGLRAFPWSVAIALLTMIVVTGWRLAARRLAAVKN